MLFLVFVIEHNSVTLILQLPRTLCPSMFFLGKGRSSPNCFILDALFLLYLFQLSNFVQGVHPIHIWKENMVYFDKSLATLGEAQEKCRKMGGNLPSIHSQRDCEDLLEMSITSVFWSGAKTFSKDYAQVAFEWSDGSKFDFEVFKSNSRKCNFTCCGIELGFDRETTWDSFRIDHTTFEEYFPPSFYYKMNIANCDQKRQWFCLLPFLTGPAAISWIQNQGLLSNLTSNDSSVRDFEQQLAIDLLNETLTNLQEMTRPILHKLELHLANETKREESIHQRLDKLNETLITLLEKAHSHGEEEATSEHPASIDSNESTTSSLVEGQNETKVLPAPQRGKMELHLGSGLNVYLGLTIFVFVIVILGLLIKGNLLSRCKARLPAPSRTYSRFGQPRHDDLLPISLSTSNVREDQWRSEPLHSSQDEIVILNNPNLSVPRSSNN